MRAYSILMFASLILLVASCSTQELPSTLLYGQATDLQTGEGVGGIVITIYETSFPYLPSLRNDLEDIRIETDENGNYSYRFFPRGGLKSYRYSVSISNVPHASLEEKIPNRTSISVNQDNRFDFKVAYNGYIKSNIVNTNCDTSLILVVTRSNDLPFVEDFTFDVDDCFDNTRLTDFHPYPHGSYTYTWNVVRDSVVLDTGELSFYLEIGERKEFTIEW